MTPEPTPEAVDAAFAEAVAADRQRKGPDPMMARLAQIVDRELLEGEQYESVGAEWHRAMADDPPGRRLRAAREAKVGEGGQDPVIDGITQVEQTRVRLGDVDWTAVAPLHIMCRIEHQCRHGPVGSVFA